MLKGYSIILISTLFYASSFRNEYRPFINSHNLSNKVDTPSMRARLGLIRRDTATTQEIIINRGLRLELKGYPKGFPAMIRHFSITYIDRFADSIAKRVSANSNMLSDEQIQILRKLNGKGKIIFEEILVVGGDSKVREIGPFSIVVNG